MNEGKYIARLITWANLIKDYVQDFILILNE